MNSSIVFSFIIVWFVTLSCIDSREGLPATDDDSTDATIQLEVSCDLSSPKHLVSAKLIGFNWIYSHYSDDFVTTSGIKQKLADMQCGFIRWPGGAPTNRYHWNKLNGQGWKDNWDPNYDTGNDRPASAFTDLDEYIAICKETQATPLVGVNLGSGLKYNRIGDGVEEAKALVQYCIDKGYKVNHYYLDNEPYHKGANYTMTVAEYVDQIKLYSTAIKNIHPQAKIVINWEKVRKNSTWKIIEQAGEYIDVLEVHWYWKWGESTFSAWLKQHPMNSSTQWYEGGSYKEEIEWFNAKVKSLGFEHIKLASLEWNVGPSPDAGSWPTKYQCSLMQGEMLLQFMDGGLDMATMWPIFWPKLNNDYYPNRYLMDPTLDYQLSPSYDMFKLASEAMGKIRFSASCKLPTVYPLVVATPNHSEVLVYLHQKGASELYTSVKAPEYANYQLDVFRPDNSNLEWGRTEQDVVTYHSESGTYRFNLPAYSIARLKLKNKASDT